MKIPELSSTHKIAVFCLFAIIIIIMLVLASPVGDKNAPAVKKELLHQAEEITSPAPGGVKTDNAETTVKSLHKDDTPQAIAMVNDDPEKVSPAQLFARYRKADGGKVPEHAARPVPVKEFAQMIAAEVDSFSDKDFKIIEMALSDAVNLNIGTIGIEFAESENQKLQILGFELITKACISHPRFFQPHKFFAAFAKKGFAAEPFISEIIENTKDDFCREWACELYVEIFYHNTDDADNRHRQLAKIKSKEADLLQKIVKLLANTEQVEKIIASRQNLGDRIRAVWGNDNRYSLKLLQVTKLLDNLNTGNRYPTTQEILNIINTYNFNYNILNRVDGKPVELAPIPPNLRLKYLAHAVFGDKMDNTFQWVHQKDGGFTKGEVEKAVNQNNQQQIKHMNKVLNRIVCAVLKGKLLLGMGNHELEILRYFYFAKWDKQQPVQWSDRMIIIRNQTGKGAPLLLATKPDTAKILTGKVESSSQVEEKQEAFYIPPQSSFIWFVTNGDYHLAVNKKNTVYKPEDLIYFQDKKIRIDNTDIIVDIF